MKNIQQLENDIIQLTAYIAENYPELYRDLDETMVYVPDLQGIAADQLESYFNRLKAELERFNESDRLVQST